MKKAIYCKELFDSETGEVNSDMEIVYEGDTVTWVGKREDQREEVSEVIDLSDKFVMPGLIDSHMHTAMNGHPASMTMFQNMTFGEITVETIMNVKKDLLAGFTMVRDEGSYGFCDVAVRNGINTGKIDGPRMFVSGIAITATGGHADSHLSPYVKTDTGIGYVVDSPDAGRKAARYTFKYGADQLKVMATGGVMSVGDIPGAAEFSEEEMSAILQVAKSKGRISSAHAHGADGIKMAIRCGITSIEHGMMMDDECIDMMAEHGVYLVPTIIAVTKIIEMGTAGGLAQETVEKARMCIERHGENLKKCRRAGVKIVFGTDAGTYNNYHGKQAEEFALMQKYGDFSVRELLLSATKTPAQMMGLSGKAGCIKPGSFADVVAADVSPWYDITAMEKISFVMKEGKVYKYEP